MPLLADEFVTCPLGGTRTDSYKGTGVPTPADNEVSVYLGTAVVTTNQVEIDTTIQRLGIALAEAFSGLTTGAAHTVHLPVGGEKDDAVVDGTPTTADVTLHIGAGVAGTGEKPVDTAVLIIRQNAREASHNGVGAPAPPPRAKRKPRNKKSETVNCDGADIPVEKPANDDPE